MNHPEPEKLASYSFGELKSHERRHVKAHLYECAHCRETVETWRRSLNRLDAWKLPARRKPIGTFAPIFQWAAATALVLCVGVAIGRVSAPRLDVRAVREAIEPELRQEIMRTSRRTDEAIATFAKALESRRAEDSRAIFAVFDKLESQHAADVLDLKKELDTVALNTDAGLRQTAQQLVQLVGSAQPTGHP
jgi:hypothetical protein